METTGEALFLILISLTYLAFGIGVIGYTGRMPSRAPTAKRAERRKWARTDPL